MQLCGGVSATFKIYFPFVNFPWLVFEACCALTVQVGLHQDLLLIDLPIQISLRNCLGIRYNLPCIRTISLPILALDKAVHCCPFSEWTVWFHADGATFCNQVLLPLLIILKMMVLLKRSVPHHATLISLVRTAQRPHACGAPVRISVWNLTAMFRPSLMASVWSGPPYTRSALVSTKQLAASRVLCYVML